MSEQSPERDGEQCESLINLMLDSHRFAFLRPSCLFISFLVVITFYSLPSVLAKILMFITQ